VNLVQLEPGEKVASVISVKGFEDPFDLVFVSRGGLVKRTPLEDYGNVRSRGLTAVDVIEGDELLSVALAGRDAELLITTRGGMSIRFGGEDVRPMGRVSRGVRGIDLEEGDAVVDVEVLPHDAAGYLLTATELGNGKRTELAEHKLQGRGGKGVIAIITDERNGPIVGAVVVQAGDQVIAVTDGGQVIRMRADDVRITGRNAKGVRLMRLADDEKLVAIARLPEQSEEGDEDPSGGESAPAPAEA
jgi:DNA gyrase subunit A